jgi:hypothetical protein
VDNRFEIRTDRPSVRVSWQVTGVRNDAYARHNPMQVEVDKPAGERGRYLHPEVYGATPEQGIHYYPPARPHTDLPQPPADRGLPDVQTEHDQPAKEPQELDDAPSTRPGGAIEAGETAGRSGPRRPVFRR